MEDEGWSNLEAYAEMEFFDAHLIWQDLRNFVKAYRPRLPAVRPYRSADSSSSGDIATPR